MLIELLRNRRSIRRFTDQAVSKEDIDLLIESALRSPSSKGNTPWEFLVIQDKEMIRQLAQTKPHGAAFLQDAPLAIVVCADPSKSDVWIEDASIAALLIHLAAADQGLGSCWVQTRLREHSAEMSSQNYLSQLLSLPKDLMAVAIIGIGHPQASKPGHDQATLLRDQVHMETFKETFKKS